MIAKNLHRRPQGNRRMILQSALGVAAALPRQQLGNCRRLAWLPLEHQLNSLLAERDRPPVFVHFYQGARHQVVERYRLLRQQNPVHQWHRLLLQLARLNGISQAPLQKAQKAERQRKQAASLLALHLLRDLQCNDEKLAGPREVWPRQFTYALLKDNEASLIGINFEFFRVRIHRVPFRSMIKAGDLRRQSTFLGLSHSDDEHHKSCKSQKSSDAGGSGL
jgi:hypothetical protein